MILPAGKGRINHGDGRPAGAVCATCRAAITTEYRAFGRLIMLSETYCAGGNLVDRVVIVRP